MNDGIRGGDAVAVRIEQDPCPACPIARPAGRDYFHPGDVLADVGQITHICAGPSGAQVTLSDGRVLAHTALRGLRRACKACGRVVEE